MKRTFTLIIALLLTVSMYAFPNQSALSVSVNIANNIYVTVDGARYQVTNNFFQLNNLSNGYHQVQVYQQKRAVRNGPFNNYQLLSSNRIFVKPQYHIDITINRFGRSFVDEQPIGFNNEESDYCDNNQYNNNWNPNNNNWNNTTTTSGRIMNTSSFEQFKQTLRNESFENTKLNLAKQVIAGNLFSTIQIKELMEQFSFENNKLELAKYAYQYTIDKGNYFTLANEFSFSNSKESLMRHIQNNR